MEKISVCMATYNGAAFIRQQIESILPQLESGDEIIFSDDGSTDATLSVISGYNESRFKIIKNQRTGSPTKNFEKGLRHCTGELIFLTDQDDVWMPDKVSRTKHFLKSFDLVLTDCSVINERNEQLADSFFKKQKSKKGIILNLVQNSYMGCCMAFHRKVLDKALPFPLNLAAHDQWIGLIAERYFKVYFLNEPLVWYRRHNQNYSFTGGKSSFSLLKKINHRITMINNLYNR
jgi:glycosyltransferase involved in cell wall biosynthesis